MVTRAHFLRVTNRTPIVKPMKRLVHLTVLSAWFSWSCAGSNDGPPSNPSGGTVGTGGASLTGGTPSTGGSIPSTGGIPTGGAQGGTAQTGGLPATGGVSSGGTTSATGGALTGGSSSGGSAGNSTSGGGVGTGGAAAGASSGGAATGGTAQAGSGGSAGAVATGGAGGSNVTDPGTTGDGDFTAGPTYTKSPDLTAKSSAGGKNFNFTMNSADSKIYTGLDTTLNQPKAFTRRIDVHVPAKYQDGTPAPFMVVQDGAGSQYNNIRTAVDNLSQATDPARRLPAFIVIAVANGGGDSLGSQRGLEYDTMSDRYSRLIDEEVLPAIVSNAAVKAAYPNLKFTDDPEGRGTAGCSSGGAAAVIMGWFKPDRYRRIIGYSTTLVAQQDTDAPERTAYPHGAWDFHSDLALIANSAAKPIRVFINANENDNGAGQGAGNRHDWLLANQRTAAALKAKNYHYRYVEGKGAGHCDGKVQDATIVDALLWVWRGYPTTP